MLKNVVPRSRAIFVAFVLVLVALLLFVPTGCGGGGGGSSSSVTSNSNNSDGSDDSINSTANNTGEYSGYLYAPIGVSKDDVNSGMVVLQTSTPPTGYRAVSDATVYVEGDESNKVTTDEVGHFSISLVKGKASGDMMRLIAIPSNKDKNLAPVHHDVFPPYEGGDILAILLHPDSRYIKVGETIQLYAVAVVDGQGKRLLNPQDVSWSVDNPELGTIDNNGVFKGLKEGEAMVTIQYQGFTCTGKVDIRGEEQQHFNLYGKVVYSDGTPAAGAVVVINGVSVVGVVDAQGNYYIPSVPGFINLTFSIYVRGVLKYTKVIYLTEDTVLNVTLPLDDVGFGKINGTVTDEDGNSLTGVLVTCCDVSTSTDEHGKYLLEDIPEGSHQISFTLEGYNPKDLVANVEKDKTTIVDATLQKKDEPRYGTIKGRVMDENHNGISGASVVYEYQGQESDPISTDSNGFFYFQNLSPGIYTVKASKDGYDSVNQQVSVVAGEETNVEIIMSHEQNPYGNISGIVRDDSGNPLPNVTVTAGNETANTDADGRYTLYELTPGSYSVTFTKEGYKTVVLLAEVVSGSTTTLDATMPVDNTPKTGTISGVVKDVNGVGIANAEVMFASKGISSGSTRTDSQGRFSFQDVNPGSYRVTASKEGYISNSADVDVVAGQNSTCNIVLENAPPPVGEIQGTVTDEDGNPLQGVYVKLGSYTTVTSADGKYALAEIPVDDYIVYFSKQGYKSVQKSVTIDEDQVLTLNVVLEKIIVKVWQGVGPMGFTQGAGYYTSLAMDGATPYVAFRDASKDNKISVMKYNGTNWVYVGSAGFSAGNVHDISIYIYDGVPYVAYRDYGYNEKIVVKKFNGTSWVNVGNPGFSDYKAYYTSIYVNGNGVYVAYRDEEKATVKKFNGTNWVNVGSARFTGAGVYYLCLRGDSSGTLYLAFRDGNGAEGASVMKFNGTQWVYVGSGGFSKGIAENLSLYIYDDVPYVAYTDWGNNGKATVMKYTGNGNTGWEPVGTEGFTPSYAYYTNLVVYNGVPYVAFSDYRHASLMKYEGGQWQFVGDANFTPANARYVSLAMYGGVPYVAFTDYANDAKVSVMKYDQ